MPEPVDIPVVILCGGQGTRIREASEKLPKPLIDIGGRPILWHIMKLYGSQGFRKFICCLGYKAWDIKQYFLNYDSLAADFTMHMGSGGPKYHGDETLDDWEISLIDTGMHTGTGGRLAKVAHMIDSDYFMLSYGDGVADINLRAELKQLADSDYMGLVTGVHPTSRYGELATDGESVTAFAEKPPSEGWVSGGFFAFRREFLNELPTNEPEHFFEHAPVQRITREGKLGLFSHEGFWMGMDTYREYSALNEMWANDSAPWKMWD